MRSRPNIALLLACGLILGSCSCNYHLKRVRAKCPTTEVKDTITIHDTVRVPEVSHDTTFYAEPGDTVYVKKDRLKYRYINLGEGRHNIAAKCDTVFLNRFIKVPYTKEVYKFDWLAELKRFWWVLLILVALFAARKLIR